MVECDHLGLFKEFGVRHVLRGQCFLEVANSSILVTQRQVIQSLNRSITLYEPYFRVYALTWPPPTCPRPPPTGWPIERGIGSSTMQSKCLHISDVISQDLPARFVSEKFAPWTLAQMPHSGNQHIRHAAADLEDRDQCECRRKTGSAHTRKVYLCSQNASASSSCSSPVVHSHGRVSGTVKSWSRESRDRH